jgi:hypothetical protein
MKTRKLIVFLFVLSAFVLQACGPDVQAGIATGIAQTQQISALQTAAAGGAPVQSVPEVGESSNTVPLVSVSQNTNCRSGPRVDYTLLTTINVGQQVEVLKIFSNDYVLVKNPNGSGDCWLFLQFADTTDFNAFNLTAATQPPTPKPTNTPKPPAAAQVALNISVDAQFEGGFCNESKFGAYIDVFSMVTTEPLPGPVQIFYWWELSDGSHTDKESLTFSEAGENLVEHVFDLSGVDGWVRLFIVSPEEVFSNQVDVDCK